jgi:hypothetical protein
MSARQTEGLCGISPCRGNTLAARRGKDIGGASAQQPDLLSGFRAAPGEAPAVTGGNDR